MSFIFTDSEGNILNSDIYKDQVSKLENGTEIDLYIRNDLPTKTPGLFLTRSTDMGEISYPAEQAPATDKNDILFWGSNLNNQSGLYLKIDNQKVYFSYSAGSSIKNRILIQDMANLSAGGITKVTLGYDSNQNVPSRRLYIGLEVYDSYADI